MLLFWIIICISFSSLGAKEVNWDGMTALTDLGKELKDSGESSEEKALNIIDAVVKLGELVPELAPFAMFASAIIGIFKPDEMDQVKQMTSILQEHLFQIEHKIDAIANLIRKTTIEQSYKDHEEKVIDLFDKFQRQSQNPNNITTNAFVTECKKDNMMSFAHYIDREVRNETILSLRQLMSDQFELKTFGAWSKTLVTSLSKAIVLHSLCLAATYPNNSQLKTTILNDEKTFKTITDTLTTFTKNNYYYIKDNFYAQSRNEITNMAHGNTHLSHHDFVIMVHDFLSNKYFWRSWLVVSYSGSAKGFHQHCVCDCGKHMLYWFREYDRSVYIGSTNNRINYESTLQACINSRRDEDRWYHGYTPQHIYDDMRNCLGNSMNGLAVVRFGNGLWGRNSKPGTALLNVEMSWAGYTIVAIAPEISGSYYRESVYGIHNIKTISAIGSENFTVY